MAKVEVMKSSDSSVPVIKINWLDRTIGFFSPKALLKRKKAKIYSAYLKRKYEGADSGRRTAGWNTNNQSANAEISVALPKLRDRSRDLVRNNPFATRGVQVVESNVVGRGITTQLKVDTRTTVTQREKALNNVWQSWAKTTACDFEGSNTFAGLQRLAMRAVVESGEVFIRRRRISRQIIRGINGKPTEVPPVQLQILEADFLATNQTATKLKDGNSIIQGIEIDKLGKRVAYHFFLSHPGSNDLIFDSRVNTVRVPAKDVMHLYRMDRPGQLRGVPWLSNIMLRLRDFDIFEDATLKRQQTAAMYTAFVHDIEGFDDTEEAKEEIEVADKMEPGIIEFLPPGKEVTLADPPATHNYAEYASVMIHSFASGLGITYASLSGNLSEVNFSSGRMGFIDMQRNFDASRESIMTTKMIKPAFDWFSDGAEIIGLSMANVRQVISSPRREMIDPDKELGAMKVAVRSGFKTLSEVIRETGVDPDFHFEELKSDNDTVDRLKLTLDTDVRKVNNTGTKQQSDNKTGVPNASTKK